MAFLGLFESEKKEQKDEASKEDCLFEIYRTSDGTGWRFWIDTTHPGHILHLLDFLVAAQERLMKTLEVLGYEEKLEEWDEEGLREEYREKMDKYDSYDELWKTEKEVVPDE